MTTNPFFSGRIPQDLYDHIEEYREQTAESKTEILIRALAQYVDYPLEGNTPPPIKQTFEEIFSRLAIIESKIANYHQLSVDNNNNDNKLSTDNNKQLSVDNEMITKSEAVDLQPNNTRQYTNLEVAKVIKRDRSAVRRIGEKIREGKSLGKSAIAKELEEAGFRPSETHENRWVKVK